VTTVRVSIQRPADELASRLDRAADSTRIRLNLVDAVNDVTQRFELTAARAMNAGLALEDSYVRSKIKRTPAVAAGRGAVRAEIVTRGDLTILGNYPHRQLNEAGTAVRSGASKGRRPSGARVEIRRGAAVTEPQWFVMKLRGTGGKEGIFVRTSEGRTKHIYGPSPYSLFRFQINRLQDDLQDDLQTAATTTVAGVIERSLLS
jgi:hypothetical protein